LAQDLNPIPSAPESDIWPVISSTAHHHSLPSTKLARFRPKDIENFLHRSLSNIYVSYKHMQITNPKIRGS